LIRRILWMQVICNWRDVNLQSAADFNGMKALREACGKRFGCGVVAYDGELTVGFGDGMFAVPLAALWT
jgi:hypothetical protein